MEDAVIATLRNLKHDMGLAKDEITHNRTRLKSLIRQAEEIKETNTAAFETVFPAKSPKK
jgi:hypothetical protein